MPRRTTPTVDGLLLVDKPAGVAVHGGSGIAHGGIERLRAARPQAKFLELVHRLDRETSGVLQTPMPANGEGWRTCDSDGTRTSASIANSASTAPAPSRVRIASTMAF